MRALSGSLDAVIVVYRSPGPDGRYSRVVCPDSVLEENGELQTTKKIYRVIYGDGHYDCLVKADPEAVADQQEEPEEDLAGTCQADDGWDADDRPLRCVCPEDFHSYALELANGSACTLVAFRRAVLPSIQVGAPRERYKADLQKLPSEYSEDGLANLRAVLQNRKAHLGASLVDLFVRVLVAPLM